MTDKDDDSTTNMAVMAKQRFEEDRRRSRLFGSNARRVPGAARRKKKKKEPPPCAESIVDSSPSPSPSSKKATCMQQTKCPTSRQDELAKSRPWAQTKKFVDPSKSKRVQTRPWHVGYINAPTASGNPSAQAARYGPDGAFNLRIQCADRISREAGKLEAILRNGDDVEQYNSVSNKWSEPLRLGEAHLCSTPKMWGSESSIGADKDDRLPQRLKNAIDNDTDLWKEMALSVRAERDKQTTKGSTKGSRRPWRDQWGTAKQCSSQQPQRVFCLR